MKLMSAPILMIDDDPSDCELMALALEDVGMPGIVQCECDAREALASLIELPLEDYPKLVLLDLNMPTIGGKDVLRALRDRHMLHDLRVVIFSTSSRQRDVDDCLHLGAWEYVVKPRDYHALVLFARRLLLLAGVGCV